MAIIKINGVNYDISPLDNKDTISNMIALQNKTFPSYIRFTEFNLNDNKISVEILSDVLPKSFPKFLDKLTELSNSWNITQKNIILEWLHVITKGTIDPYLVMKIAEKERDLRDESSIKKEYARYTEKLSDELKKLENISKEETEYKEEYDKYKPLETTQFIQDSVIIEYKISLDLDPLDLFNNINLSEKIPFARLIADGNVYYKIYGEMVPPSDWLEGTETLVFRIKSGMNWILATINYIKDGIYMTIETTTIGKQIMDEKIINDTITQALVNANIQILHRQEKGLKGIFAVPEIIIARDVFLDLVTNDPMISHYIYVNEVDKLASDKGVLYLYYNPITSTTSENEKDKNLLTIFLSQKTVSRTDPFYLNKDLSLFTPYLNIRISRAQTTEQIERFKEVFATILDIYVKKYDSIVNIYQSLIPDFKKINIIAKKDKDKGNERLRKLQALDPELFIYGYSTNCEKKHQPVPIEKAEIGNYKDRQVMNYPDGSDNYFICPDYKFRFPGLKINKLDNKDTYEYLPCCYPIDQKTGGKKWNEYLKSLHQKKSAKKSSKGVETTKTGISNIVGEKTVSLNKFGYLPRNIHIVLSKNITDKKLQFLRTGVPYSKNSFIHAVLLAIDEDYSNIEDKESYVQDFRTNLVSQPISDVIQQVYNYNQNDIKRDILNTELPFDSKLFVGFLESIYDCQIIVFERSNFSPNGDFEIPRYTQGYLYNKISMNKDTILIYKHYGARSDNLSEPHYELIIGKYMNTNINYFTIKDNPKNLLNVTTQNNFTKQVITSVYSYFQRIYKLYTIGHGRYNPISLPDSIIDLMNKLINVNKPPCQIVDQYGKLRGLLFEQNVHILFSPLTPIESLPICDLPKERPSLETILRFANNNKLTIEAQDISADKTIGLLLKITDIQYSYIPCKPSDPIGGLDRKQHLGFSISTGQDLLKKSLVNRKIADNLMQLLLYSFSIWYEERSEKINNQIESIDKLADKLAERKTLINIEAANFLENQIIVISDHDYDIENLPRQLSLNTKFFKDNKLIADSKDTAQRLNYYLYFMLNKHRDLVLKYSERKYLDNYYTYASDFTSRDNQLVFVGDLSINNWINAQKSIIDNYVHSIPDPNKKDPLFFAHWALQNGKPIIIQNVIDGDYKRALAVAHEYMKTGINTGYNTLPITEDVIDKVYFFEDGVLKSFGSGRIKLWRYRENYYAAILIPTT